MFVEQELGSVSSPITKTHFAGWNSSQSLLQASSLAGLIPGTKRRDLRYS